MLVEEVLKVDKNQDDFTSFGTRTLDERQRRERDYHVEFAKQHRELIERPVALDVIEPGPRRPWNAYWTAYDLLIAEASHLIKRALVPGCGFGDDSIRLAQLGFEVYAFDLSDDLVQIARQRAKMMKVENIHFDVMPAEELSYPDGFFDVIFFNDILHHVNILKSITEAKRVAKVGGKVVANELYTHSLLQKIRESRVVTEFLYRRMVRFIYGTNAPYITEDEHKIDENEQRGVVLSTLKIFRY